MTTAMDVQSLLRFLSQDAKVPLAQALGKVKDLQSAKLITAADLAKADFESLKTIFADEKVARQVLNAAKRVSKKRTASEASGSTSAPAPSPKKARPLYGQPLSPAELEASLALPEPEIDEEILKSTIIYTNRAPLVLAFAVTLLKHTMPEQPISSRLSLAQAVTSLNSKSKALHIGLDSGKPADAEGWGDGQPLVRIMTRDIRVMKRWGYDWDESPSQETVVPSTQDALGESQSTLKSSQETLVEEPVARESALWGIDLEALRKANQPDAHKGSASNQLPIYTAQSARAYLMKAFESPTVDRVTPAKKTAGVMAAEKERNLGLLLGALELLYQSWAILSKDDLNKRAWGWYVRVRPDVAHGAAGWGGKGNVKLSDILELRKPAS